LPMQKKASILLVGMWVLAMLVVFALSLGFRSRTALKISNYQRSSLNAYFVLTAGLNRAIYEIMQDTNGYDALCENWSDDEEIFSRISPSGEKKEFCTISYQNNEGKNIYGVTDEQSRININKSGPRVIEEIFNSRGLSADAKGISALFKEWVSPSVEAEEDKQIFKNGPLLASEELLPLLEYFYKDESMARQVYVNIEDLITVYGEGKLNINTASEETLYILCKAYAETEEEASAATRLAESIVKLREGNSFFNDIASVSLNAGFDAAELSLWSKINASFSVKSNYFRINAQAVSGKASKTARAVFKRDTKEIVYWHQN